MTRVALPAPPRNAALVVALSLLLTVGLLPLQADIGLSLYDEGFLWYGAQRVLHGELPLRDFQAYDIGRYYWAALGMWLAGSDGIIPMRAGNAVLAAVTVMLATGAVSGVQRSRWLLACAAVTFALWMVPPFKVADSFAAVLMVVGLARAIESPGPRRWAQAGFCLGIGAMIGINHALYGLVGGLIAAAWLHVVRGRRLTPRCVAAIVAGGAVGYLPVLALDLFAPGFFAGFIDMIRQIFEARTTNLPLPLPRFSAVFTSDAGMMQPLRESLLAFTFVAGAAWMLLCCWRLRPARDRAAPAPAMFVAAFALAIPYLHYTISRADTAHVAVSALPVLIAAWAYPTAESARLPALALVAVMAISLVLSSNQHPIYERIRGLKLSPVDVQGEKLHVDPIVAAGLEELQTLTARHASGDRSVYVTPYSPGAYAALRRRSPTWEIYALFPATPEREEREIERLQAADVGVAVLYPGWLDDRRELGFESTHPRIVDYLRRCFDRLPAAADQATVNEIYIAAADRRCASTTPPAEATP